jgi:hypothetical protein
MDSEFSDRSINKMKKQPGDLKHWLPWRRLKRRHY